MRTSLISGLVFANASDSMLKKLTANRSMSSVPFGARYRIIDFALSNLVNAGVTSVGIITKENYRSLMDHIGSGKAWDLDRKNGGIYLLPPYSARGVKKYIDTVDALHGAMDYLTRCKSEYIVLYDSYTLANFDIAAALESHIEKGADVTVLYHNGSLSQAATDKQILTLSEDDKISKFKRGKVESAAPFSLGVSIVGREFLIKIITDAYENGVKNYQKDVLPSLLSGGKVYGFEHKGYVAVLDNTGTYYEASMALLNSDVREQLFNKERPIFTKTRDDMPTRYGINAKVKNALIADGCIIEGTVKNSIIFRGVKVEKNATVENCILMQETVVKKGAVLDNVIADKNSVVSEDLVLKGTSEHRCFIKKSEIL